ncbi:MAG: sulfatase-like hydrolase/transferase [Gemmatimonadaceae bacterium]
MTATGATPRRRLLALFALLGAPVLFITWFALRYGYQPVVVALHVAEVLLAAIIGFAMMQAARKRVWVTVIGATMTSAYWTVVIVSAITNEAWGWSVSLDLARSYLRYLPDIGRNLPVSPALIPLALLAGLVFLVVIWVSWWRAAPFVTMRRVGARYAVAGVVLAVFVMWARERPYADAEPFTALVTAPGHVNAADARAHNARARREYAAPRPARARNVIVIFSDALRADHMGLYGYARATTPFLSRLDSAGRLRKVKLAMATCPFTACGVVSTLASRDTNVLELGSLKLQDVLHDRGYRTYFIGASDHTVWYTLRLHYGDAVDYFFDGFSSKRYSLNDDRLVFEGLEGVPSSSGAPAFFYFFLTSTHVVGTKLPEFRRWTPAVGANAYDNGILQADHSIAAIFDSLKVKGYLDSSIVVILGDHGDAFGEHGITGHTLSVYQETLHIPLIFMAADTATWKNLEFATQSDVAPTILDLLGMPRPSGWEGVSLRSDTAKQFSAHWTDRARPWRAVIYREGGRTWKYMYVTRWGSLHEELYELTADPGESNNLVGAAVARRVLAVVRGHGPH